MTMYRWVGKQLDYDARPLAFPTKAAARASDPNWGVPIKIMFHFEDAWCVLVGSDPLDPNARLKLRNGGEAAVLRFALNSGARIIGLRDLTTADGTRDQDLWRGCMCGVIERETNPRAGV